MDHRGVGNDIESHECPGTEGGAMERNGSDVSDMREPLLLRKRTKNTTSQIAIVGANICPIESLDYEIVENDLFKQDWRSRRKVQIYQYIVLKWTLALLIGLGTGLVGFFNNLAVENIAGFKLLLTSDLMLVKRYYMAFFAFAGCNLVLAAIAAAVCAYIAPAAAGSGIPEVKAYLNGVDAHSILARIIGSIFGVSAGFVLGKEGPMVHTGACIASILGQGGSRKYHLTWTWLRYFKNDRDRRDLITCGAAAGVAAAFRAPVGGVLFALEEAASWWRSSLLWRTFFTTAVVAVVLRTLIEYCQSGKCGLFGKGGLIMFDISSTVISYSTPDLLVVLILGVTGGIFGGLFNFLLNKILRVYSIINEEGMIFQEGSAVQDSADDGYIAGDLVLRVRLPWFARCTPCPAGLKEQCPTIGRSGNFKNFQCPPGHYNDLASLFLNTNDDAIRNLFSGNTDNEFRISTLLIFFTAVYLLGLFTYGIAVPSGLFIPVILAGASYGRIFGTLLGSVSDLDAGLFALLGAASFLGGTMRMTVSVCVILLELTNDLLMLPLVMLVLLVSKTVADSFNKGVYDQIVTMKGLPYMEAHAEPYMRHLVAGDVKVGNIMHGLRLTGHHGFPVVDEPPYTDAPELCGLVLRSHLLVLLKGKKFTKERVATGVSQVSRNFGAFDFAKAGSGKGSSSRTWRSRRRMEMYVDLHPITNTSPYTVVETMSLAKAAVLFRELGLRHLCVVPKTPGPPVVGILTRHDFMPEHILGLFPHFKPRKWS
ncbi:unnamed protein product [Spirodela intermedia]|uniref:Chloride channel protein n=1 Tax=Spirodela intermedia TaxID=51605 RepID=A0A7I8J126_SPIIN|nr:unnamed protein product [Spirodela intermedia]CAA6663925.1 unnamed protein product [Spirodela intermedia]